MRIVVGIAETFDDYALFERSMVKLTSKLDEVELMMCGYHKFAIKWTEKNDIPLLIKRPEQFGDDAKVRRHLAQIDICQNQNAKAMIVFGKDKWTRHILIMGRFGGITRVRKIAYEDPKPLVF